MKNNAFFPVIYMFVVTAFFSSVLIGFSKFTRKNVDANARIAFERAVISVLPMDTDIQKTSGIEMHNIFVEQLTRPENAGGAYVLEKDGKITGYALPVEGKGFWAPIKGVVGIGPDRKSLIGIAFYEQNETPGLGAEITQPKFRDQFKAENNKVISQGDKPIRIVRPGAELKDNQVNAVTGATQTSDRLEKLLNEDIVEWQKTLSGE